MGEFVKHPSESYPIGIDYAGKAPTGAQLLSGTWAAYDMFDSVDATSDVLQNPTASITGDVAKCRVLGGEINHTYRLSLTALFSTGDILHDNIYMQVSEEG